MKPLKIGKIAIGGKRPVFILGPCVIESEKFVWRMAREISKICRAEDVDLIFKASYDKANRTSVKSFRGLAPQQGCELLAAIGEELKVPVTTDVHSPDEAKLAGTMIDLLQIPAFLCWMREAGYRVIFDATHSVQRPGGGGDKTSGDGALAPVLARAAVAVGCDGIFMEVHENPTRALSDAANQVPLKDLPKHLRMLKAIHAAVS